MSPVIKDAVQVLIPVVLIASLAFTNRERLRRWGLTPVMARVGRTAAVFYVGLMILNYIRGDRTDFIDQQILPGFVFMFMLWLVVTFVWWLIARAASEK